MNPAKKRIFIRTGYFFLSLAVILVFLHIRPVRLKVLRTLESSLERKQGLKLTASSLNYNLFSLRFKLGNVSLSGTAKEDMPVFFEAEEISVRFPLAFFFKKGIHISSLGVRHPRLNYFIDQGGERNLPFPEKPRHPRAVKKKPKFRLKRVDIENAQILYVDESGQMSGELPDVGIQMRWIGGNGHSVQIRMEKGGHVLYQDIELGLNEFLATGHIDDSRVDFDRIDLNVSESRLEFSGGLSDFSSAALSGKVKGILDLKDVRKIFPEMSSLSGRLNLEGEVEGPLEMPSARLRLQGTIQSFKELKDVTLKAETAWRDRCLSISPFELSSPVGRLRGTADLYPLDWKQGSRIELEWDSLGLDSLAFLSETFRHFSSQTSGNLQASWSDLRLDSVEGRAEVSVFPRDTAKISPEKIPASGLLRADLSAGKVTLAVEKLRLPGALGEVNILANRDSLQGEWGIDSRELAAILPSLSLFLGNKGQQILSQLSPDGSLKIKGDLGGSFRSPVFQSEFTGENISFKGLHGLSVLGKLNYRPSVLEIDSTLTLPEQGKVSLSGSYPLSPADALNVRISGQRIALEKILSLSGKKLPFLGSVNFSASVSGDPKEPQILADLSCPDLRLYGEPFDNVDLSLSFRDKKIVLKSLEASKSDGFLKASGWFDLRTKEHLSQFSVDSLRIDGWQPPGDSTVIKAIIDLSGESQGKFNAPQLLLEGVLSAFSLGDLEMGNLQVRAGMKERRIDFGVDSPLFKSGAHGSLLLDPPFRLEVAMDIENLPLQRLSSLYPVSLTENLSGECGARLEIAVDLVQPADTWTAQARINRFLLNSGQYQIQNVQPIAIDADSKVLRVEDFQIRGNGLNIEGEGSLSWSDGGQSNFNARADVDLAVLSDLFQNFSAAGSLKIDSHLQGGPFRETSLNAGLALSGGRFEHINFPHVFDGLEIQLEVKDNQIEIQSCVFDLGSADFSLAGKLPFHSLPVSLPFLSVPKGKKNLDLRLGIKNLQPALLDSILGGGAFQSIEGKMDADILIQGAKFDLPQLTASMKTESFVLKVADFQLEQDEPMEAHLDQGRVIVSPFSMSGADSRLKVGGSIDLMKVFDLDIDLAGELDFGIIQGFVKDIQTQGKCGFEFQITGAPTSPLFGGFMSVQKAGITLGFPRFYLEDLSGRIQFEDNRLVLKDFGGLLNGGKVEMGGGIGLEGWSLSEGEIALRAEDVIFDLSRSLRSQISSDLRFNFSEDEKILSGMVNVHHGQYTEDIDLESSFFRALRRDSPSRTVVRGGNPWLDSLQLQVGVTSLNPLVIENNLLRSQISAAVNLTGTFRQPGLTGRLESLEGGKLYFGKNTFLIRQATVDFINPRRIEPDLNVTAETKVGEYDITLTLSGTPDVLSASLTSEPPLTEPNIVSLLVMGVTLEGAASSLLNATGSEAISYLDSVLTGRLESALENTLGLESVRIDAGLISGIENPEARITLQQHLSRNLELIYSQNLQAARNRLWVLDYNPLRSVNVQGVKQDNNEWSLFFRHEVSFGVKPTEESIEVRKRTVVENVVFEGSPAFPERKITNRLHLRPGSRYDHLKLYDGLDRLREMYASHFFLNPSIRFTRTEEDGKMQIGLRILSGPKVILEFSGDPIPTKIKKDASLLWIKTSYDRMAVASIEERLQQYFIDKRHFQVAVSHQESTGKDGEKRVVFKIAQGIKYKKPELLFEGNRSFSAKQLEEIIRRGPDFYLLFIEPRVLIRKLRNFYVRNGFLQVQLDEPRINFFPGEKTLTVTLPVREGSRYKINNLAFEGNVFFGATELGNIMNIRKDDIYRGDEVGKAVFAVEEAYARKGFNQVELEVLAQEDEQNETVDLSVKIQENLQGSVGEIRISGNSITSEKVISRELELQIGDMIDYRLLNKARKRLYDLGVFKRVQIEAVPLDPTSPSLRPYRIEIEVVELRPYRLRYGLQYDTETSLGVSTELINRNLFGRSMLAGANFRLNRDEKDFKAFYRSPSFLSKKISTEFFIFYNSSDKPSFSLDRGGLTVQQQTRLGRFSILSCSYSYEQVWTHFSEIPADLNAADTVHHEGELNLAYSRDTRDNIMNASRGLFLSQNFGYAAGWLGSEVSFLRYYGELYTYQKISKSFIYAFAFRLGLGHGLGSELSLSQRFFAGGGTTIRGFKKNEVGPKNPETGLAEGGDVVLIMNHELRLFFSEKWSAAIFLDAGNIYSRAPDIDPFDLREAAGFGIRFHTRFILIRADWGFKLDRRPGESLSRIFFSIGQVF
jgi:outer membrane protein assembly complex protein YaeT